MRIAKILCLALSIAAVAGCQRDDRKKSPSGGSDQKIVDDTQAVLGGIFDIINDLELGCPDAAAKLAAYEKDNAAKLDGIAKEYQSVQKLGGARAADLTKQMARLVGNNTPAFRRFAKRCPEQSAGLEKTLDQIGGAEVKKLAEEQKRSRSEVIVEAVRQYLKDLETLRMIDSLNEVYSTPETEEERATRAADLELYVRTVLSKEKDEW